jgi:hypothetical protein
MIGRLGQHDTSCRVLRSKNKANPPHAPATQEAVDTVKITKHRPHRNFKPVIRRGFAMALLCAAGHFGGPQSAWAAGGSSSNPVGKKTPVPAEVQDGSNEASDKKWYRSPVEVLVNAQTKVELFKGQFSKTEQVGDWRTTQGINGLVQFEGEYLGQPR